MNSVTRVANGLQRFKQIAEEPGTLAERVEAMKQIMIDLTMFENTPPCLGPIDPKECILAREVYEYATFLAVEQKNIEEFERHICVVKSFYDDFGTAIPASQKKSAIIGLYLLYLLSFNKISQYHTEIELISQEDQDSNIYIKVPVSLETYFVQGSYQQILSQQQNVPLKAYQFFIDKFVDAIRFEVARSAERSYDSLALSDCQKMLMLNDKAALLSFIDSQAKREGGKIAWQVKDDRLHFMKERREVAEIPNTKMMNIALGYATELNRII